MVGGGPTVPLTALQQRLLATLAASPAEDQYLAGGAAIHLAPNSTRFSDDLDFFHDSEARVAAAFAHDRATLEAAGYAVEVAISQPGFIRAIVRLGTDATRVDWAHDSAWRFMPLVTDPLGGRLLHPVDLAINKLLALAGREEPRDFVDLMYVHEHVLAISALAWAAPGKDPGLSPGSLVELLQRRGHVRQEELDRLQLAAPLSAITLREQWQEALASTREFVSARPPAELGCLYLHRPTARFVVPASDRSLEEQDIALHFGAPGGVVPRIASQPLETPWGPERATERET